MTREGAYAGDRGDVEYQAAAMVLFLPHHLDSIHGDTHGPEEECFELIVHFLLGCRFSVARKRVTGVVDKYVDVMVSSKVSRNGLEGIVD